MKIKYLCVCVHVHMCNILQNTYTRKTIPDILIIKTGEICFPFNLF